MRGNEGDEVSRLIDEAVSAALFDQAVAEAKAAAAKYTEKELTDLIDEAVDWARGADPDPEVSKNSAGQRFPRGRV